MKSFNFGGDREDIGPFVSASLPIVCPFLVEQYQLQFSTNEGLVQSPAYNIDTVYFMDWSF